MTAQNLNFDSTVSTETPVGDVFSTFPFPGHSRPTPVSGLSGHVRRLHKSNQGISRWLLFAVLGGAIVAFAMVQYAIH
jgi:hypothetical protein